MADMVKISFSVLCGVARLFSIAVIACSLFLSDALARTVSYEVKSQSLTDVIDTLSDLSGIAALKTGSINGKLENWRVKGEGVEVFETLARDSGLFMAFDGSKVILASRSDVRTTVLPAGSYDWAMLQSVAKSLFPIMPKDALEHNSKTNLIIVRGPSSFTEAISSIAARPKNGVVRIIKGGSVEDIDPQPVR